MNTKTYRLIDVIKLSYHYYKLKTGDDKQRRARLDVVSGKITNKHNFKYDTVQKKWVQTGKQVKIEFTVRTSPISYKKIDTLKYHTYPITFVFDNIEQGIYSTFKWRTGSLKKPIIYHTSQKDSLIKKQLAKQKKQKKSSKILLKTPQQIIAEKNIKRGVQLQFFFELEYVLAINNLLYGRCWATRPPVKTNPKQYIFFDKHAWFIVSKFLLPLIYKINKANKKAHNQ